MNPSDPGPWVASRGAQFYDVTNWRWAFTLKRQGWLVETVAEYEQRTGDKDHES